LRKFSPALILLAVCACSIAATADSLYGNSVSANAASLGGAVVASPNQPLEIMMENPAGLAKANTRSASFGFATMFTNGNFSNSVNNKAPITGFAGAAPYGAFVTRIGKSRFHFGAVVAPESALGATWHYNDPPGGIGGTTYGMQRNHS